MKRHSVATIALLGWLSIVSSYVSPLRSWIRAQNLLKSGQEVYAKKSGLANDNGGPPLDGNDDNTEEEAETNGLFKLSPTKKPFIFQGSARPAADSSNPVLGIGRVPLEESPLSQRWYKRKQSFISPAQKRILREHWPTYGIELKYGEAFSGPFFDNSSSSSRKVALDIGFGTGDSIVHMAAAYPNCCYLGVEIHRTGIAKCIGELIAREISSERVRLVRADVLLLLERHLPAGSLDEIHCYFPDPWPNEYRDGERRVVRERTVTLFAKALKSGGLLHIATDVPDYAKHVERTLTAPASAADLFTLKDKETYEPGALTSRLRVRGLTKYERRAAELGHSHITEFLYQRN